MNTIIKIKYLILGVILLALTGCACVDPLEPVNRQIFNFNMAVDRAVLRPVAQAYDTLPPFITCRIGNFFDNLDDLTNIANNALQFKLLDAWSDCWRFAFNTTFGFFGLFDVATCAGLPKHHQDFGLTLARYGFVNSTYLMLPFFGPTTIRDTIGWTVDWRYLSIWGYIKSDKLRYSLYALRLIHKRACLLPADKLIDDALDPYVFIRDAYLQRRECEIRSICPPCDESSPEQAAANDSDDTFVPENGDSPANNSTAGDPNDTFVPDDSSDAKSPSSKTTNKPSAGADPFVDP